MKSIIWKSFCDTFVVRLRTADMSQVELIPWICLRTVDHVCCDIQQITVLWVHIPPWHTWLAPMKWVKANDQYLFYLSQFVLNMKTPTVSGTDIPWSLFTQILLIKSIQMSAEYGARINCLMHTCAWSWN